jgi:Zn-dependent M32 family carboxypeptidase
LSVKADLENQVAIQNELLEKFQFDLNSAKVFFLHFVFLNIYKLLIVSFIKDQISNDNVKFDNENQSFLSVKADLENQVAIKNELLEKFRFDFKQSKVSSKIVK